MKPKARGNNFDRASARKRTAVSTGRERSSKAEQTEASSDTSRLEDIPVSRRQGSENREVEAKHLVRVRDVRYDAVLLPVWNSLDSMA